MSPEAQRIAIAKACGEINPRSTESGACIASTATSDGIEWGTHGVADYLNDLNAMREAAMSLSRENLDYSAYCSHLNQIIAISNSRSGARPIQACDATAAQRAEAYLRALNLWQESPPTTP